jgi:hypothetical protein
MLNEVRPARLIPLDKTPQDREYAILPHWSWKHDRSAQVELVRLFAEPLHRPPHVALSPRERRHFILSGRKSQVSDSGSRLVTSHELTLSRQSSPES